MEVEKKTFKQKAENEFKELGLVCGYLFLVFAATELQRSVILAQAGTSINEYGWALINSLAIGKVMLIAKQLHFAERPGHPIIVSVLIQSAAFSILLMFCKVLEDVGFDMYKGKTFMESLPKPAGRPIEEIGAIAVSFFILLIPFFAFSALSSEMGEGVMASLFLKPRAAKS
jgi:hypothetical protein